MIKVRHFAARSGVDLAYEIEEWLEHPAHEFISLAYSTVYGAHGLPEEEEDRRKKSRFDGCERALLVYLEHEVPVV